jgi:hypothetical protein
MKLQKYIKEIFITTLVISLTAAWYAAVSSVAPWNTLTSTIWNEMKAVVDWNTAWVVTNASWISANTAKLDSINKVVFSAYETDNVARSYSWQTIFNNAKASNTVQAGKIYDCVVYTNNGSHYNARRFTAQINWYDNFHRINNITDVDSGYLWGCSTSLYNVTWTGFDYVYGNCNQSVTVTCNKLN